MAKGVHYRKRKGGHGARRAILICVIVAAVIVVGGVFACSSGNGGDGSQGAQTEASSEASSASVSDSQAGEQGSTASNVDNGAVSSTGSESGVSASDSQTESTEADAEARKQAIKAARAKLDLTEDFHKVFYHGKKPAKYQKYIVLHDTEGDSSPKSVVEWWAGNGNLIAAHFVVGKDGSIVQCVPLDKICHHAGYGDKGHNKKFGIKEDGRDDMKGAKPVGSNLPDYGMNAWSIGIEMVHVGGAGGYPKKQLEAVDDLIAYLDAYYDGNAGTIIDHKMWRTGNSDTSKAFAKYLKNYRDHRTHD